MSGRRRFNPYEQADKLRKTLGGYQCDFTFAGNGDGEHHNDNVAEDSSSPIPMASTGLMVSRGQSPVQVQEPHCKLTLYEEGQRVRTQLGGFQCDVSFDGDRGLKENEIHCQEHCPDNHKITIPSFKITDLKEGFQKQEIMDWITFSADLTVLLKVGSVSTRRVTEKGYPFSDWAGAHFLRSGSGCIEDVHLNDEHSKPQQCPCEECQKSDRRRLTWGVVSVSTATHVVFDDFEAKNTTVHLFFDEESERIRHKHIKTLKGFSVIRDGNGGTGEELTILRCITHMVKLCEWLRDRINKKFMAYLKVTKLPLPKDCDLAVMISHPHGQKKRLTFGKVIEKQWHGVKTLESANEVGGYVLHYEFTVEPIDESSAEGLEIKYPDRPGRRVLLNQDSLIPTGTIFFFKRDTMILLPTNDEYTLTEDRQLTLREGHINLPSGTNIAYLNEDIFGVGSLTSGISRRQARDGHTIEHTHHCPPKTIIVTVTPKERFTLKSESKFINSYFYDPIEFRTPNARPRFWSNAWNKLLYDTPSCNGSSGAKVLTIKDGFYGYPHSCKIQDQEKKCGIGRPW